MEHHTALFNCGKCESVSIVSSRDRMFESHVYRSMCTFRGLCCMFVDLVDVYRSVCIFHNCSFAVCNVYSQMAVLRVPRMGTAVTNMLPGKAVEERSNEDTIRLCFPPECV